MKFCIEKTTNIFQLRLGKLSQDFDKEIEINNLEIQRNGTLFFILTFDLFW